jgi:hypothetical protein
VGALRLLLGYPAAEANGRHKGRTTRAPWDPVLVQIGFRATRASQAYSKPDCIRKRETNDFREHSTIVFSYQKKNLAPNCTSLGGAALITWPKVELAMFPSTACGPKNCAWLNALKASSLN